MSREDRRAELANQTIEALTAEWERTCQSFPWDRKRARSTRPADMIADILYVESQLQPS